MIDCEVKGVTTRGGKTTTQDLQDNNTNVQPKEPRVVDLDKMVGSNEVLTKNQPQKINESAVQPSSDVQTPPVPFPKRLEAACMKPELEKIFEEEKSSLLQVLEKLKKAEDLVADHLSRFKSLHMEVLTKREIADKFSDEHLMELKFKFKDLNHGLDFYRTIFRPSLRFGVPIYAVLSSDRGMHFCNSHLEKKLLQKDMEMDDPNITKAWYFEDIDYFKDFENQFLTIVYNDALTSEREISSDFENEFPAIVYNDALTSEPEVSSEPT
ncbi:hypothetical protein Tco_0879799, partial [Tanacetum coccineum]